jgi:hypothetical protein
MKVLIVLLLLACLAWADNQIKVDCQYNEGVKNILKIRGGPFRDFQTLVEYEECFNA